MAGIRAFVRRLCTRYTIIRRCNARNKYNTVTTMEFTDAV